MAIKKKTTKTEKEVVESSDENKLNAELLDEIKQEILDLDKENKEELELLKKNADKLDSCFEENIKIKANINENREEFIAFKGDIEEKFLDIKEKAEIIEVNKDLILKNSALLNEIGKKLEIYKKVIEDKKPDIDFLVTIPKSSQIGVEMEDLLQLMTKHAASDLHLKVGSPPMARLDGELVPIGEKVMGQDDCMYLLGKAMTERERKIFTELKRVDFARTMFDTRFRFNVFLERGNMSASIRMLKKEMPSFEDLMLPSVLSKLSFMKNGLILLTGPAGTGKSTTLASMINHINSHKRSHIITIEDPIEFLHKDKKSIITQREIGVDADSFIDALTDALRQDPDILLIGEMRDPKTIEAALMAAETGHLVLSTLHTMNTSQAIDRILDAFPKESYKQMSALLSNSLRAVISQKLLPRSDGEGRVPAVEVMIVTPTIKSLIREGKVNEIYSYITQGEHVGMQSFTMSLTNLFKDGLITKEEALYYADQPTEFHMRVTGHKTETTLEYQDGNLINWL